MRLNMTTMLAGAMRLRAAFFDRKTLQLQSTQTRYLREVMTEMSGTPLGNHLGLRPDLAAERFRQAVPVQSYADFAPFAERLQRGETRVATRHPALFVAISTGTTGARKMLPITRLSHAGRQRSHMAAAGFMVRGLARRGAPLGRLLIANGAAMLGRTEGGTPFGFTSACERLMDRAKYRGRAITPYPFEILTVPDFNQRCLLCFLFAVRELDLRFISGNFPPFLTQMAASLAADTPVILDMLRRGGVPDHIEMPPDLRRRCVRLLRPDPARADALERAMGAGDILTPDMVWPGLSVVFTGFGEANLPYVPEIRRAFGNLPIFGGIYSSTEAIFGVHTDFDDHTATLSTLSGFYEFIPEEQWEAEAPQTVLPHEVEVGRLYRIVVTNLQGLCRYDIGDVVRVTGWHNQTPRITFVRRKNGILSAAHEMTSEDHIDRALALVSRQRGIRFGEVAVTLERAPVFSSYLWLFETAEALEGADLGRLAHDIDAAMSEASPAYRTWRDQHVPPPRVALLPKGAIAGFLGQPAGPSTEDRLKPHRILNGRPGIEALVAQALHRGEMI